MRRSVLALALVLPALCAGEALALQPCFHDCHLGQGTPLFLQDVWQIWWRRCDTPSGRDPVCVVERADRSGKVLATRRSPGIQDRDFVNTELGGHTVIRLEWQNAWTNLAAPYTADVSGWKVKLALEGDTLVCSAPGQPTVRRPLGCVPKSALVSSAASGTYGVAPLGGSPIVITATCSEAAGEHEAVALCEIRGGTPRR